MATLQREESGFGEVTVSGGSTVHVVERKFMSVICRKCLLKLALKTYIFLQLINHASIFVYMDRGTATADD